MERFSEFHKICTQMSERLITPLMIPDKMKIISKILNTINMARPIKGKNINHKLLNLITKTLMSLLEKKRVE